MNENVLAFVHAPLPGQATPVAAATASPAEDQSAAGPHAPPPRAQPRPAPPLAQLLRIALPVGLVGYVVTSWPTATGATGATSLPDWLLGMLLIVAAILCFLRSVDAPRQRAAWTILGLGLSCWGIGQIVLVAAPSFVTLTGSLSPGDVAALGFYPAAYVGLLLLLRATVKRFSALLWLDGLAGALAVSAVVAAFAFPPVLADAGASLPRLLSDLSFPLADLMLIAVVVFTVAMTAWRPGASLGLVTCALLLVAVADGFSLWWNSTGHLNSRTVLDSLWPLAVLLIGEAAARPPAEAAPARPASLGRSLVLPVVFSLTALALLVSGLVHSLNGAGYELATAALAFLVVRMLLTALENLQMARTSRREALTDALTGLGNRRKLMMDLQGVVATATKVAPTMLMLFDLDGFKLYNDTFGHPAGDALLARLGAALRNAVEPWGRVYRLGGDEFCSLCERPPEDFAQVVRNTLAALSERGQGFTVSASMGSVLIPNETADATVAMQLADQRLYERKGQRRRGTESQQARNVLLQALRERHDALPDHLGEVATLAQGVARHFGLNSEQVEQVTRAAELHDIGKMAIPETILEKPAPLDESEMELMRQHTLIGERILAAAPALRPVGELVRASHERFDGKGYPDGLVGEEIPLGARIIAVCDAYDAMTGGRPYQPAISAAQAVEELRRCAGGQFDPKVVDAFAALVLGDGTTGVRPTRASNGALAPYRPPKPESESNGFHPADTGTATDVSGNGNGNGSANRSGNADGNGNGNAAVSGFLAAPGGSDRPV